MEKRRLLVRCGLTVSVLAALTGCTADGEEAPTPELDPRGTVFTTVKPERRDLANTVSLAGKVSINPIFGIVAPADGELRFLDRTPPTEPLSRPTWVATVWSDGRQHRVEIPGGAIMAGRLMADRSEVTAGMPIVSAAQSGYGIVADIESDVAYRISGAVDSVQAQIKNGPGPFRCDTLGTIAALPAGTVPEPEETDEPETDPEGGASPRPAAPTDDADAPAGPSGSEATGLQLVCVAPDDVQLINGAAVTLELVTGKADDVLVLPVEAVAGRQGRGKVDVVGADRTRKTVDVVLGLTDGKVVEIKKGLRGTEEIAVPGPDLPAAEGDAEGEAGKTGGAG